jgi:hypothetical protein
MIKEQNDILIVENIRLKKVNNQLIKEVEQKNSLVLENKSQESNNKRSDIKIDQIKEELDQCITELENCIESI